MKIVVHTLVKNEARYVWFAVRSVIDYVDKVMLWDTGSTDDTLPIIKELRHRYPEKISFREVGEVTPDKFTQIRQEMLVSTKADWLIIVDGDEVWWNDSIKLITDTIRKKGAKLESIVNPYYNAIGDIYHYQEEKAGKYEIDGRRGHITIRAMNLKIPGLHLINPHGTQGFMDADNVLIQNRNEQNRIFLNAPYLHFTHLQRSSILVKEADVPKRQMKLKHELGIPFRPDFFYPEVFFYHRTNIVPYPWVKRDIKFTVKACIESPLRALKRKWNLYEKTGY